MAPPSSSAPNSARANSDDELARLAIAAPRAGRNSPCRSGGDRGSSTDPGYPPRRLSRVRTPHRGDPDRGARSLHARGRSTRQRSDRNGGLRRAGRDDRPIEISPWLVVGRVDPRAVGRPPRDAPNGPGAARAALRPIADGRPSPGTPLAALLSQPRSQDRCLVQDVVAGRADDAHPLDGASAVDGGAGRGKCRDLGAARSSASGACRSRPPGSIERGADRRDSSHP